MRARLPALALALVALLTAAWFGLGVRQAHDTDAASAIITAGSLSSAAQAAHAASLLRSAKQLNPDTQVDVWRAQLELRLGNRPAARRILQAVVAQEPKNALAWEWLARASAGDPHEFFLAVVRIRELVPAVR